MPRHIIITPCTKNKCIDHTIDGPAESPEGYLTSSTSVRKLTDTRSVVLALPGSAYNPNSQSHYPFDLYVRHPRTQLYRDLRERGLDRTARDKLLSEDNEVEWFFISGGYGVLHALEPARSYQATLEPQIAHKEKIPSSYKYWLSILPNLFDEIFGSAPVDSVHVFGSSKYFDMVSSSDHFKRFPSKFIGQPERATSLPGRRRLVETVGRLLG